MSSLSPNFRPLPTRPSMLQRHALLRVLLGALLMVAAMPVVMALVGPLPKPMRLLWPNLLSIALMGLAYRFYALRIDRRDPAEFALAGAGRELGLGLLGGLALVCLVFGALAALDVFRLQGMHGLGLASLRFAGEMAMVAVFEDILVRGIVFKAMERWLGSLPALFGSALLFGLAHLPNEGANPLSTLNVTLAGLFFAAAYLASGRLWLGVGLHFAWNFSAGHLFSAVVSGHKAQPGLLYGELVGPTWLSGGAFGIEASAVTLLLLIAATAPLLLIAQRRGRLLPRQGR
ncbi:CPBP family intramembrane metalloprotease [Roseateles sp. DAIF2]|uniref:CPBP family intramembrane glutamic endopeptidase n=1 Tax=Roseateles sp. DAIF2 TaxID=2714952 RepID=UPI0018A32766|nr:CPBP family intramembrane glutamic endopeptidase [Roseateles sp. DAIF2]QPF73920.1 CPBP family intramembrane metalloprotease [Roseateles sp. DAIF2]